MDVRIVTSRRLAAAAWSRFVSRSYLLPPESDGPRFLERLLAIGAAEPGLILLPTSDETAWLYSENAESLGQYFCMYHPPITTLRKILDKGLFAEAARNAGIDVLPSWDCRNLDELKTLAPTLPYPILIKPRTHVHRLRNDKGIVVDSASELIAGYLRFVEREQAQVPDNPLLPGTMPILQQFVTSTTEGVHSITGFIDRTGELFVTRRATKVFQRSPPVGVGVCFESLPAAPSLSEDVRRLCVELGYFGMFEVEFLWFNGRWAAIDFNPRLFNQVGMDIRRGMPLPLFACLEAAGETAALRAAVSAAMVADEEAKTVHCDRFTLRAILLAQALTGRTSRKDRSRWYAWLKENAGNTVNAVADRGDPMPGLIHVLSELYLGVKAFPRFLRIASRAPPVIEPDSAKRHS
jgi:predicted ATP-grasp superfamily ATP-dependent carboligase